VTADWHFAPPSWVQGGLSTGDAAFLVSLVAREHPRTVIEIGVAAGTSSAALLYALDQLPAVELLRLLHSVDVRPTCYFDPLRLVGSAVADMYPEHQTMWILDTKGSARRVGTSPQRYDLAFIDGDHRHPWPLFDLLHLAPVLIPGAWVALHDISLPRCWPKFPQHGAQWLFEQWSGEKVAGVGDAENIGAVRLPANLRELNAVAVALVEQSPWQTALVHADVALAEIFAPVTAALATRLT
jgi:hypothetical protein